MSTCHRSSTAAAEHTHVQTRPEAAALRRTPATPGEDQDLTIRISEVSESGIIYYFTLRSYSNPDYEIGQCCCSHAVVEMCGLFLMTVSGVEWDIA